MLRPVQPLASIRPTPESTRLCVENPTSGPRLCARLMALSITTTAQRGRHPRLSPHSGLRGRQRCRRAARRVHAVLGRSRSGLNRSYSDAPCQCRCAVRPHVGLAVKSLSSNKKTKDVPITVLKNSNYHESLASSSILDYLLKQNLSPEDLYKTVKNSLRFRRTQLYLYQAYKKRKDQLLKIAD